MRLGPSVEAWPPRGVEVVVSLQDGTEQQGTVHGSFLSLHTAGRRVVVIVDRASDAVPIYTERIRAIKRID